MPTDIDQIEHLVQSGTPASTDQALERIATMRQALRGHHVVQCARCGSRPTLSPDAANHRDMRVCFECEVDMGRSDMGELAACRTMLVHISNILEAGEHHGTCGAALSPEQGSCSCWKSQVAAVLDGPASVRT